MARPGVHELAQLIHDAHQKYPVDLLENAEHCARVILMHWPARSPDLDLRPISSEPYEWTVENMG